jgi:hypothetical protein
MANGAFLELLWIPLDPRLVSDYSYLMTARMQGWICVLLAICVLVILLLPVIPVPVNTLRGKHSVRPAHVSVAMTVLAPTRQSFALNGQQQLSAQQARLATRGPDLLDLTSARLC